MNSFVLYSGKFEGSDIATMDKESVEELSFLARRLQLGVSAVSALRRRRGELKPPRARRRSRRDPFAWAERMAA